MDAAMLLGSDAYLPMAVLVVLTLLARWMADAPVRAAPTQLPVPDPRSKRDDGGRLGRPSGWRNME